MRDGGACIETLPENRRVWSGRVIFEEAQRIQKLYRDQCERVNIHRFSIQFSTQESAHLATLRRHLLWLKITRSDQVIETEGRQSGRVRDGGACIETLPENRRVWSGRVRDEGACIETLPG